MKSKRLYNILKQDFARNYNNPEGLIIISIFRYAHALICSKYCFVFIIFIPRIILCRMVFERLIGVDLSFKTKVSPDLVINDNSVIGGNVALRHCATIGIKSIGTENDQLAPVIGNTVNVGSTSVILGNINISSFVIVGSDSVVINSIPGLYVVAGNPANIIS